jgi:chaperonin GroEL (HSP60 family)
VLAHSTIEKALKYLAAGMKTTDLKRGIEAAVD